MGAHERHWWRRRGDINHLLRLIQSSQPVMDWQITRRANILTDLQVILTALPDRQRPRHLMVIRGRS